MPSASVRWNWHSWQWVNRLTRVSRSVQARFGAGQEPGNHTDHLGCIRRKGDLGDQVEERW